ncbi:hypothetical protein JZ751_019891 [Albula glossodonta]|uniref:Uncharacterized protein n=1 Tax=Albula glossodonta TaxID=121402 RepID=A0A8T2NXM5_9TELE|nr:hypothetical protein JZ751_019891 [Albula glossodonta]
MDDNMSHPKNTFCSGDHVSWHSPLDNSESRIQHMLLTEDPQMQPVQTPFGLITFLQIVGVCTEELQAAQQWNGQGILDLLRGVHCWRALADNRHEERGDYIRHRSSLTTFPGVFLTLGPAFLFRVGVGHIKQERVDKGIETDGSNLSGVSAKCSWDDLSRPPEDEDDSRSICIGSQPRRLSDKDTEQIREALRKGLEINSKAVLPPITGQRQNHERPQPSRSPQGLAASSLTRSVAPLSAEQKNIIRLPPHHSFTHNTFIT